ncbi:hypothetical protein L3Q82_002463 [Scortum barcoo]|uniref:Uncharacterized protein n=1 Tax=Scortum barcoo TaxID=214431 RepID=A0ACB8VYA6_9TELE|nr:hypothetical protein L3Q82_002463 [Scortum barcoo]
MGVDPQLMDWISDYLTGRPQYVGLKDIKSDTVVSSTGAPQGTVLAPLLFTLYTSDFCYNSELCHIQKYADDTAIVGCIRDDREEEYRRLVGDFASLHGATLTTYSSTPLRRRSWFIDFGRSRPRPRPVLLEGAEVEELLDSYRYLGLWLDNKLDYGTTAHQPPVWEDTKQDVLPKETVRSFNICSKLLQMFYQSVVASVLFYTVVCWGGSISKKDTSRLDKLIRRAGSVCRHEAGLSGGDGGRVEDSGQTNCWILWTMPATLCTTVISNQRSLFSERLLLPKCRT